MNLEINNIRGIKKANIELNGSNTVIFGPNGTGKSAVIDSLDFLLKGKMTRFMGEGTKYLPITSYGGHIDSIKTPEKVVIKAKILLNDSEVLLERNFAKPSSLKVSPTSYKKIVEEHLETAKLGQHILSRREILKFINAEAGKREKQILALLDLNDIGNLRRDFVKVNSEADKELKNSTSNFEIAKNDLCVLISVEVFSEESIIEKINHMRALFKGTPIISLQPEEIKSSLEPYLPGATEDALTNEQVENYIKSVRNILEDKSNVLLKELELKKLFEDIKTESKLRYYSAYKKLFEAGISIIDKTNICPLCGKEWTEGDFKSYLEDRSKEMELSKENKDKISKLSLDIKKKTDLLKDDVKKLLKAREQFQIDEIDEKEIENFFIIINKWSTIMLEPLKYFEEGKWPKEDFEKAFNKLFLEEQIINPLEKILKLKGDELSEQQKAWDTLTKMEEKVKKYIEELKKLENAQLFSKRAQKALEYFNESRDIILGEIYNDLEDNFVTFYKELHSEDEESFKSKLSHNDAELLLDVDFYGKGMFPPNALHSEGHQDSMGLCLFFALNKYLSANGLKTIALDDVVMSIDREHRKSICDLINKFFKSEQFIITTHDTSWAKQLNTQGIVSKRNMLHFFNWNIDTGPIYELDEDLWDQIGNDLDRNDIPAAAYKLRRNSEWYFENVCDFLSAKIPYKGTHQWELGDLAPSAISTYKEYLKRAKVNSEKIGNKEKFENLKDLEKNSKEIINNAQIEQWVINENVHYNRWAEYSKKDFEDVVEAYKNLFGLFMCNSCNSMISVNRGKSDPTLSCSCGEIFWNIKK
ncbi:MAG: AAA family ATPase [Methanobacterium sp.]|uniref:AAA family ATPase n=1 Tax=Methanobacterium sp. TaxID=2164 RepID=UPI003D655A0E|nr:AAA family ATPase [Methanobacterium sp.]